MYRTRIEFILKDGRRQMEPSCISDFNRCISNTNNFTDSFLIAFSIPKAADSFLNLDRGKVVFDQTDILFERKFIKIYSRMGYQLNQPVFTNYECVYNMNIY